MHNLTLSAALAPVGVGGVFLGIYLVRRISMKLFYRIAYWLVFLLALQLIWDGTTRLMAG